MDILPFCERLFLFDGVDRNTLRGLLEHTQPQLRLFARKETIYSPTEYERKIGFLIVGECEIARRRGNRETVPLNTLRAYDSFGILALFSEKKTYPTVIYAKKQTEVLFFEQKDVESLIAASSAVAMNMIRFLSDRVDFLNEKIATLSGGNVEEKLAKYLLLEYEAQATTELTFNAKKTAECINCGRASLYRALDSLCAGGIIQCIDKKIIILSPKGLERITS